MENVKTNGVELNPLIKNLMIQSGGDPETFKGELISQMIESCLKLIKDDHTIAQLKVMNRALKEMRYAYRIFNKYPGRRFSIFGSARTPEDHPDYVAAKELSMAMTEKGWMCITGAAHGIMKAGHEGSSPETSFGLSIRLPNETSNPFIEGDPKHIHFRYFFTRKLMFLSHSDAVIALPGGIGTMDELYESLTLMQTGKSHLVPIILFEGNGGKYWSKWQDHFKNNLLANGWVSPEDKHFFHFSNSIQDAVNHIERFYKRYHSMRYVKDDLVIRLNKPLSESQVATLNKEFGKIIVGDPIRNTKALPEEDEVLDLPRIVFTHTRRGFGLLRAMIDRINDFP